ncbi:lysozyme inhibitor LprI family protein [Rossellomorea sp. KS-H15a]|uniref:lysozyme inhibitor LprI family protein n=1 Tax=Rossellomorea sp. KS-H15a TaxID=2963940 RepID=UPI0020C6B627|nr:lysozyme inhibitor LprI family protein [Rossellomorea sp. KS-H15a]UTE78558.1 lysozyme inhibitor LprI family protein [Rossellomorea sp. KS-H15a]
MKKSNWLTVTTLSAMVFVGMSACSQSSEEDAASKPHSEASAASNDSNDSQAEYTTASGENEQAQSDETSVEESHPEQESAVTKVEGKQAYLDKLDNIQKELDAMPDKKDSDKGVTNAMKNYYGVSYEKYDDALNEIYSLLKEKLSPEVMAELKSEQVKWIEEKEAKAEKERLKYEGGTFENVAWYISLYESTKARCYELVEEYMTE